ncbi:MAG TPA: ion transporter [Chitinophagaceae bacterium]|nr:ion transporter [Chitinophagaceae bacterium]
MQPIDKKKKQHWRERLHEVIYESNTLAGKVFDLSLMMMIVASILVVIFDSIEEWRLEYGGLFNTLEWIFTIVFTIEYMLRLISIKRPLRYMFSFLGIVDLLAIIPSYLSFFFTGTESLLVFRALRLLRIFRIFKLSHFIAEMRFLGVAIRGSLKKISIFMLIVLMLVIILGSVMYLVEDGRNGFTSIPESIYWAIVTITTVGYGDITPVTPVGKMMASLIMLIGYAIIAVPTGIITTEMALAARNKEQHHEVCPRCGREGHDRDANFCKICGEHL